jgi:haloalkane dehalogenase
MKGSQLKAVRRLYPFRSHFLTCRCGASQHYLDEGKGEPVVMIHGNPTWSFYFREMVRALSPHYRVIAPDHLGCGLSDTPSEDKYQYSLQNRVDDLEYLINSLDIDAPLTLVVHDWGGMIGMAFAAAHPHRIGRLVVTNTAAFPPPQGKPIPLRLRLIRDFPWFAAPAVQGCNLFVLGALAMAARRRLAPAVRIGLKAPYDSWCSRLAVLRFVQDIPLRPSDRSYGVVKWTAERLPKLADVPMLICWGMGDFVFDRDYLREWRRRFPKAAVKTFPDAGHYLLEDAPQAACRAVRRFLDTHPLTNASESRASMAK